MSHVLKLPKDFPKNHVLTEQNIAQLISKKDWDTLDEIPICIDRYGKVVATFMDTVWDLSPFSIDLGNPKHHQQLDFRFLTNSPGLLLQAKTICYCWLYQLGHKSGLQCKLSTITGRMNQDMKVIFSFLQKNGFDDICVLGSPDVWMKWQQFLAESALSMGSIRNKFVALSAVVRLRDRLPFNFEIPFVNFHELSIKLAANGKKQQNQTLAIPQPLADILYGEAVKLVELAWPHRTALANLEKALQSNYEAGKSLVDHKISSKKWLYLHDLNGRIKMREYSGAILKFSPISQTDAIMTALNGTDILPKEPVDGTWFKAWRGQLQTACFICCGAFSGMRISEIFELRQDSFSSYSIDGKTFHAVRAATHKLAAGKKREEWLCSPVVEKAIAVAVALSTSSREKLMNLAECTSDPGQKDLFHKISDCLWLSQANRSSRPIVIPRSRWNRRLWLYAKNVGAIVNSTALAECLKMNPQSQAAIATKVHIGQPWPFTTHQFRRTFACFAVRHHLGHPIAIKQQFKHLYVRMSDWYCNGAIEQRLQDIQIDSDIVKILNNSNIEHTTLIYEHWFNSSETLTGGYGKAIVAMRQSKPVIYSSWDNLYRLVKEKRLTLHGTLHSYCKNGYECNMDGVVNPALCIECNGSVIDSQKALWWQQTHNRLTIYLQEQANVSLGEYAHCITQIRAAEQVMRDHHIDYQAYQHPVEVINL